MTCAEAGYPVLGCSEGNLKSPDRLGRAASSPAADPIKGFDFKLEL